MREEKIKMRVMFTHNFFSAHRLTTEQRENGFFLLYYQFLKHAFGLQHAGVGGSKTGIRIYFDKLPDNAEKCFAFKGFVTGLNANVPFRQAGIFIRPDQLAEVDSKQHVILQALDIVLGAMQFRLNDKHKEIPEGETRRGKRTLAKERVYKHILTEIRTTRNGRQFNIGINTGDLSGVENRWADGYRHWIFKPKEGAIRPEFSKRKTAEPKK